MIGTFQFTHGHRSVRLPLLQRMCAADVSDELHRDTLRRFCCCADPVLEAEPALVGLASRLDDDVVHVEVADFRSQLELHRHHGRLNVSDVNQALCELQGAELLEYDRLAVVVQRRDVVRLDVVAVANEGDRVLSNEANQLSDALAATEACPADLVNDDDGIQLRHKGHVDGRLLRRLRRGSHHRCCT